MVLDWEEKPIKAAFRQMAIIALSSLALCLCLIAIMLPGEFSLLLRILSITRPRLSWLAMEAARDVVAQIPLPWASLVAALLIVAARYLPRDKFSFLTPYVRQIPGLLFVKPVVDSEESHSDQIRGLPGGPLKVAMPLMIGLGSLLLVLLMLIGLFLPSIVRFLFSFGANLLVVAGISVGLFLVFILFPPIWALPVLIACVLIFQWWWLSRRSLALAQKLGLCLLLAGQIFGFLLPGFGKFQTGLAQMITLSQSTERFRPVVDDQLLSLECTFLPFGSIPPGVTVTVGNPTVPPATSEIGLVPFYLPKLSSTEWISVTLAPGETRRLVWPLRSDTLGSLAYVEASNSRSSLSLIAACSMLYGSRQGLMALGALLTLAGLLCLGVGWYRTRRPEPV